MSEIKQNKKRLQEIVNLLKKKTHVIRPRRMGIVIKHLEDVIKQMDLLYYEELEDTNKEVADVLRKIEINKFNSLYKKPGKVNLQ